MADRPPERRATPDEGERRPPSRSAGRDRRRQHRRWGPIAAGRRRGQSTTLEYTLSLAVATLVMTALFVAAGDFVTSQREEVVRTELSVIGEHLASEVTAADRLVQAGETETLIVNRSLPEQITGTGYSVAVENGAGNTRWLTLSTDDPDVTVSVRFRTETNLVETAVRGGDASVVYDGNRLEVRS